MEHNLHLPPCFPALPALLAADYLDKVCSANQIVEKGESEGQR